MRSCFVLSRNQTMGTSQPEKPLSNEPVGTLADRATGFNPLDAAGCREVHKFFDHRAITPANQASGRRIGLG
jgi:hypothetical protein